MRFITEFELWTPFEVKNYKGLRQRGAAQWIGEEVAKVFGWDVNSIAVPSYPTAERHTLEIEAFPMDKWIEFKNRLLAHIDFCNGEDRLVDEIRVLNFIKELESFGKPATTNNG